MHASIAGQVMHGRRSAMGAFKESDAKPHIQAAPICSLKPTKAAVKGPPWSLHGTPLYRVHHVNNARGMRAKQG